MRFTGIDPRTDFLRRTTELGFRIATQQAGVVDAGNEAG